MTTELMTSQDTESKAITDKVKLSDLCEAIVDCEHKTAPTQTEGIPLIRTTNIKGGKLDLKNANRVTEETYKEWTARIEPKADDLILAREAPIGEVGIVPAGCRVCLGQRTVLIRTDRQKLFPKYLLYLLISPEIRCELISRAGGSLVPHLNMSDIRNLKISHLPPIDEQKRIAAILNEQMEAVERSRQATLAQLEAAIALPAAYLRAVFNSPEAQKWERKRLKEVALVSGGVQKTPNRSPNSFHRPYLTVRNVQRGWLDLSTVERFEMTPDELSRCRLEWGDILIVEGNGSLSHIGRNAIFRGEIEDCIHQNHIIRVRLDRTKAEPEFISRYLNSDQGKAQILEKAKTTTGLHTLSVSKVEQLEAPIPPLTEQKHITANLTEQLTEVERLQQSLESQLNAINKLPATLLRRAFNGELY